MTEGIVQVTIEPAEDDKIVLYGTTRMEGLPLMTGQVQDHRQMYGLSKMAQGIINDHHRTTTDRLLTGHPEIHNGIQLTAVLKELLTDHREVPA